MNFHEKFTFSFAACLLIAMPGCIHRSRIKSRKIFITPEYINNVQTSKETAKPQKPPTITIWIHGTRLMPSPVFNSYIYCEPGLHHAADLPPSYFLRSVADSIIEADPARYNHDDFYLFGWSGKLDATVREKAAQDLHAQLLELIEEYKHKYKSTPFVRLITHSHGGNIALNLARFKNLNPDLEIEELILLACPVQGFTKLYLRDPMFKNIYSLYSSIDLAQVLAPQFFRPSENLEEHKSIFTFPPISARLFNNQNNLMQVKIKMNSHAIMHTEFSAEHFTKHLPLLIDELQTWQKEEPQYLDKPYTKRLLKVYTH